jgi:hypothetical protein
MTFDQWWATASDRFDVDKSVASVIWQSGVAAERERCAKIAADGDPPTLTEYFRDHNGDEYPRHAADYFDGHNSSGAANDPQHPVFS